MHVVIVRAVVCGVVHVQDEHPAAEPADDCHKVREGGSGVVVVVIIVVASVSPDVSTIL